MMILTMLMMLVYCYSMQALNVLEEMSLYLIPLQNWTSPSEFGIDKEDKIRIGVETSW